MGLFDCCDDTSCTDTAAATMSSRGPAYSFPILSPDEIVKCLHELQITVAADDLKRPKANTIKSIYAALIEYSTGTTQEELSQPRASALHALPNYSLHEESIPVMMMLRALFVRCAAAAPLRVFLTCLVSECSSGLTC